MATLARQEHEGSQREISRRTGLNPAMISKYTAGRELPSAPNLRRLLTKYPNHRADLAAALANDLLEAAGASDLRVQLAGQPGMKGDAKTEALIARISDRLRRDAAFRKVIAQLEALA